MSDPVRPHRWQPTRLPHPWDSPGKNTGVGCHLLLQCMKVKNESQVVQSCPTQRPHGLQHSRLPCPSRTRSLLKLMSVESVMPSNHLILCFSLLLPPSIFPSIRVFSNESGLHIRWPNDWSFSFSISPSSEYSGLISFRID